MLSAPFYPASFSFFLNPHNFIRADGYMFYINAFWKVCCPPIINFSLITLLTFHTPRFLLKKRCSNFPFWQTLLGAESSSKTNWACVHWITPVKATRFVLTNQQHRIKKEIFGIRLSCFLQAKEFIILIRWKDLLQTSNKVPCSNKRAVSLWPTGLDGRERAVK